MTDPIQAKVTIRGEKAQRLLAACAARSRRPGEMVNDLIDKILTDDLVGAVLDDGSDAKNRHSR